LRFSFLVFFFSTLPQTEGISSENESVLAGQSSQAADRSSPAKEWAGWGSTSGCGRATSGWFPGKPRKNNHHMKPLQRIILLDLHELKPFFEPQGCFVG
jgi:hypothetical protein